MAKTSTPSFERRFFLLVLTLAVVGVGYSYAKIASTQSIIGSLSHQTANDFSNSLSGFAGPQTLRYTTILAAPLGVHLWRRKVIRWPYMVGGVFLLLSNAMITSRLALMMAVAVFLVLWAKSRVTASGTIAGGVPWLAVIAVAATMFGLLTGLNYVRNANYYRDAGVSNPVAMNLYQMGAYIAVPAQVSLGVSDSVMAGAWSKMGDPVDAVNAIQPTFLQFNKERKDDSWKGSEVYGYSVSFAPNFITNSVFADTYADFGLWGWLYAMALYGVAAFIFARIMSYSNVIAGCGGVLAYCFLEVWRVQMLNYGIVIFLLLCTFGCAAVAIWIGNRRERASTVDGAV